MSDLNVVVENEVIDVEIEGVTVVDVSVPETVVAALFVSGPTGPQGPQGVPGSGSYIHTQSSPAATWSVSHTLGRLPGSVSVIVGGELVHTDVEFPDAFTVVVTFASPQVGSLRLT